MARPTWRWVVVRLALLAGSLTVVETCLQLVTLASPRAQELFSPPISGSVPDPVLKWRGNPRYPEHDAAGYRNSDRPGHAAVVVLGDSQTYGVSVSRAEAWPQILQHSLGKRVYNMALPGYCPAESVLQFKEALSLTPKQVIVSVYFGNDFVDAFKVSLANASIGALAPPDLLRQSRAREDRDPLEQVAEGLFNANDPTNLAPGYVHRVREWVAVNSRFYGLVRAARNLALSLSRPAEPVMADFDTVVGQIPPAKLRFWTIANRPNWKTILTPRYRGLVVDDSDVRVRLGVEVVKNSLRLMAEQSRAVGAEFLVVLIPTKETVFWPHTDQTDRAMSKLIANEKRLRIELIEDLESHGIGVVDVTEPLRGAARQPYFESTDGHPNALGHQLIADAVAKRLSSGPRPSAG